MSVITRSQGGGPSSICGCGFIVRSVVASGPGSCSAGTSRHSDPAEALAAGVAAGLTSSLLSPQAVRAASSASEARTAGQAWHGSVSPGCGRAVRRCRLTEQAVEAGAEQPLEGAAGPGAVEHRRLQVVAGRVRWLAVAALHQRLGGQAHGDLQRRCRVVPLAHVRGDRLGGAAHDDEAVLLGDRPVVGEPVDLVVAGVAARPRRRRARPRTACPTR
jgi:hypothetical protein